MYKENEWILEAVGKAESKPRSKNPGLGTESSQIQFCENDYTKRINEFYKVVEKAKSKRRSKNPGLGIESSEIQFC